MEQQEITVCAAITISGPLVYHLIRWNVALTAVAALAVRYLSAQQQQQRCVSAHVGLKLEKVLYGASCLDSAVRSYFRAT